MENLAEWLLGLDTMIVVILILGAFIAWELRSGELLLRWFGSIHRDARPFAYWIGILFHLVILGVVVYAWMSGLRIPVSSFFD
jgi:hypothetical protein